MTRVVIVYSPPPALRECGHRGIARRLVAVGRRAIFVVPERERPHPRCSHRRGICLLASLAHVRRDGVPLVYNPLSTLYHRPTSTGVSERAADHRHRRLLRPRRERPRDRRTAERGQEFSSFDVACHVTLRLGVIHAMEG
jgi:hypothetical protein